MRGTLAQNRGEGKTSKTYWEMTSCVKPSRKTGGGGENV